MEIRFEKGENCSISDNTEVNITTYQNGKVKVKDIGHKNTKIGNLRKGKNNTYIDIETGEIKEYKKMEFKTTKNIRRCINTRIRPLLENNFFGGKNEIFVTFTFTKDMPDFNKVSCYFDKFWKRLTRKYAGTYNLACVYVKELQQTRNSWHIHTLIKDLDGKELFIPRDTMIKIWKYGTSVGISRVLSGIDTSYDIINEEKRLNENFFISTEKRHISKLINYMCKLYTKDVLIPSSGKLYGVKGGLNPPEKQVMQYGELYKKIQDTHRLVDEETLVLRETESNNIINYVHNQKWIPNPKKIK